MGNESSSVLTVILTDMCDINNLFLPITHVIKDIITVILTDMCDINDLFLLITHDIKDITCNFD